MLLAAVLLPAAVFFPAEISEHAMYGRAAMGEYLDGTPGRLMRSLKSLLGSPLADAASVGLGERASRDALKVITSSYEYHGGFRLRTLSA